MTLLELQRQMSDDVRRPLAANFTMQTTREDGSAMSDIAESYIKPNPLLSSFERLEIYNRQYWFRVIGAVSEDFPALGALLGAKRFDSLVLAYLKENPSTSFTLRNLGAKLPVWLANHLEFVPKARRELAIDVARLEWAYVEAFDSARLPSLTEADFKNLDGSSRLALQPHLQLLALRFPVDELVLSVRQQAPESDIKSNAVTEVTPRVQAKLPSMKRQAIYLAVHRYENSVYYRRMEHESYSLLLGLMQGNTLDKALGAAFLSSDLSPDQQAASVQACFAHAAELGWLCSPPPNRSIAHTSPH